MLRQPAPPEDRKIDREQLPLRNNNILANEREREREKKAELRDFSFNLELVAVECPLQQADEADKEEECARLSRLHLCQTGRTGAGARANEHGPIITFTYICALSL